MFLKTVLTILFIGIPLNIGASKKFCIYAADQILILRIVGDKFILHSSLPIITGEDYNKKLEDEDREIERFEDWGPLVVWSEGSIQTSNDTIIALDQTGKKSMLFVQNESENSLRLVKTYGFSDSDQRMIYAYKKNVTVKIKTLLSQISPFHVTWRGYCDEQGRIKIEEAYAIINGKWERVVYRKIK